MKLIAIYIGEYKLFHKQLLTFSSDYKVEHSLKGSHISFRITHEKKLPDGFFSTRPHVSECVSSVSAIIGENGSGKTMVARLLFDLGVWSDSLTPDNVVVMVEIGKTLHVYTSFSKEKCHVELDGPGLALRIHSSQDEDFGPNRLPFKSFYFSPHYTTEQTDMELRNEGDSCYNISTTWLLQHPEGNSETLLPDVSHLKLYNIDEKIRVLEFCEAYQISYPTPPKGVLATVDFKIPVPQGVLISPHMEGMSQALGKMRDYVEACRKDRDNLDSSPQKSSIHNNSKEYLLFEEHTYAANDTTDNNTADKYVASLLPSFEKALGCQDFFTRTFMAYVAKYIQDGGVLGTSFPVTELRAGTYLAALRDFILSHTWNQPVAPDVIIQFLESNPPPLLARSSELGGRQEKTSPYAKNFFKCLSKLKKLKGKRDGSGLPIVLHTEEGELYCRIGNEKIRKRIYELIWLHGLASVISPFLKYDVFPPMSSGEMAFLSMFARLHHFVHKYTQPNDNVLVFLDETETTLHPEWQRRLVDYFIRFFEVFIPYRQYQLVFASHSPMLLSDIPAGNCCLLETHIVKKRGIPQKRAICRAFQPSQDVKNTFGANIYDLFKDGFFMKNGAIGEFASHIIQKHLQQVAHWASMPKGMENPSFIKDAELTQDLIGDRVLVQYFKVLKEKGLP